MTINEDAPLSAFDPFALCTGKTEIISLFPEWLSLESIEGYGYCLIILLGWVNLPHRARARLVSKT